MNGRAQETDRPFQVQATCGQARLGRLQTPHGVVATPAFMPVGTYGAVRGTTPETLRTCGAEIILANTLHLYLRPGLEVIEAAGGLHRFMGWSGPILTDSGGFQLMSLSELVSIDDDGVSFRSPVDGSAHRLTPERVMEIQRRLGVDIAMVLDHCPAADTSLSYQHDAMDRSTRWAARCLAQERAPGQAVFAIVQGGTDVAWRRAHLASLARLTPAPDGFALGGLAVGETTLEMDHIVSEIGPDLPAQKPRYLMGVGLPRDLVAAVRAGLDLFDCVIPTRHARNGQLFTGHGRINIANARHRKDTGPVDPDCDCPTCKTHSRAYLRHLYQCRDILYSVLATRHNLRYYQRLMRTLRDLIAAGDPAGLAALQSRYELD